MQWIHRVKPEWLVARKDYLTASEIMKLLPTTPTGRPRAGLDDALMKVWAYKQAEVSEDDVISTGVMARGHIMEPYALEALNKTGLLPFTMYHWDDTLIHSADGIAVSPDSLDVEQPADCPVSLAGCDATQVVEIKAYNAAAHYEAGMTTSLGMLPERWQLATAMYVMPTIMGGHLVFFNPNVVHPLFVHSFTRSDLEAELEMIKEIKAKYWSSASELANDAYALCDEDIADACRLETDIIKELLDIEAADGSCLNP